MRKYKYVGPAEIRAKSVGRPAGRDICSPADVLAWIRESGQTVGPGEPVAATFVIDPGGRLLIADRRSEHVACAGGGDVLAAGEVFFAAEGRNTVAVAEVTNQSTGYCPEPSCWDAVAAAFDRIGLGHPPGFTTECVFRKCVSCGARNIVKDGWFYCDVCGQPLPTEWNFD
jgi:hypothetical protein